MIADPAAKHDAAHEDHYDSSHHKHNHDPDDHDDYIDGRCEDKRTKRYEKKNKNFHGTHKQEKKTILNHRTCLPQQIGHV